MKRNWSFRGSCFFVETLQFRNFRYPGLLLPKGNYVYNNHTWRGPYSLQDYIHRIYVPSEKYSSFFEGMPPKSIGFHCKIVFFIVLRRRSWGVPLGEPEKLIFLIQYEKKLIISGDLFFVETFQFTDFRHPWLLLPKGNYVYNNYTWRGPYSLQDYIHRI